VRFIVEREHILSALAFVTKYAAKDNNGIPVLANVRLVAAAGAVTVTATDIERAASDTFKAEVGEEGSACVPARLLLGAVKGANGADVFFDAGDRQATVKAGKSQIKMPILPAGDFPPMPMLDTDAAHNFMLAAGTLARLKKEVSFAVEEKGGRFFLTGTSWRVAGDNLEFCATNGKKFSLLSIPTPRDAVGTPDIIVPEFDMPAWDDGEVEVSIDTAFTRFTLGNQVVASKLIEGTFPDYRQFIPINRTSLLFDRAELLAAINRMALVAEVREHSILLVGRDGVASISAQTAVGEAIDTIAYHGEDFQAAVMHSVASDVLSSFDCETIEWRWGDHTAGITMHIPESTERLAFVMPYRDRRLIDHIPAVAEAAE
jgi:DNA polymerase-3 subunit beta